MAKDKSSFILYTDLLATVSKLTDKKAGMLFKTILEYVNDLNPEVTDTLIQVAFEPVKQQLKRDLKKWEGEIKDRSKAGHLGGIKSGEVRRSKMKQNEANEASASKSKQTEANEADSGNVSVSVNDNVTVIDAEKEILSNPIRLEQICMNTKNPDLEHVKKSLRKFHLHLEENDKYPQKRKQVFAGFEKWLLNEKKFNNGTRQATNDNKKGLGTKSGGFGIITQALGDSTERGSET